MTPGQRPGGGKGWKLEGSVDLRWSINWKKLSVDFSMVPWYTMSVNKILFGRA